MWAQYRSAVFYHSEEQKTFMKESKNSLEASDRFSKPIITEIVPATTFYRAEEYHQKYLFKEELAVVHFSVYALKYRR